MIIKSLELLNYRNYENESFKLAPGINVFYGDNAQGKTNALESIYLCGTGKSHRGTKDKDIINFAAEESHIKLSIEKDEVPHRIDIHLRKFGKKGVAIDAIPIKKLSELLGVIHVILFAPEDLSIIKNSPIVRRNFMDMELCQLDPIYTSNLVNYNKVIIQKNNLLKSIEDDKNLRDTLPMWNEQLVRFGLPIIERRRKFIDDLNAIIGDIHSVITGEEEKIRLIYEPNSGEEKLSELLKQNEAREIAAKMSLFGPHRDDMSFIINDIDARDFGSQGQQRTAALSLKLAEIELVRNRTKDEPVLLLDDVLSELDGNRQKRLLAGIEGIQTIITCTGLEDINNSELKTDKTFYICKGKVVKETKHIESGEEA